MALVLAGGEGTRLFPLTAERCKPVVPFNGKYHIVDFVLSNLANSGFSGAHLLVQYRSESLVSHVLARDLGAATPPFEVNVLPPPASAGPSGYLGTAHAIEANLDLIEARRPDLVAIFSADHIFRMDVRQMVDAHLASAADVTVATLPVPLSQCPSLGIVETDQALRIRQFREKPQCALPMPGRPGHALASMGNYLFSTDVLLRALRGAADRGETDFGRDILPRMLDSHRLMAYDFLDNRVPGVADFEERHYWRDVGTIDSYFDAHFDTSGVSPRFRLANPAWPIHSARQSGAEAQIHGSAVTQSEVGIGCVVRQARLNRTLLRRRVRVEPGAQLEHAIVMDKCVVGYGARITRAIIDQDNYIPAGEVIGGNPDHDRQRFHVSQSGIVVVPRGHFSQPSLF